MRRARRALVGLALVAAVGLGIAAWAVGGWLIRPGTRVVGPSPWGERTEAVTLDTPNGVVRGWFVPTATTARGAVFLLHAARGDRRTMRSRAEWFLTQGYSALLVDQYGHGESDGDRLTFGHRESAAVPAGLRFLREDKRAERVVVVAWSLGGGAALLAPQPLGADALVLEAVFPTIEEAIDNRLTRVAGPVGGLLAPALTLQFGLRVGAGMDALRPIDHVGEVGCPVLVLAGAEDRRTSLAESKRLFAAAKAPKRLHVFEGLAHVDFHRFAPAEWEREVSRFLAGL